MVLSDRDIRSLLADGDLVVCPLDDARIQPASIDLTLDHEFLTPPSEQMRFVSQRGCIPTIQPIDLNDVAKSVDLMPLEKSAAHSEKGLLIHPREFILGGTREYVEIPSDLVGRVEGKSSLGRLGLLIHATAGFIDPGFKGRITLEIYNLNSRPLIIYPGKSICQLSFTKMSSPAEFPYGHERVGSKYQGQTTVTGSRYHE